MDGQLVATFIGAIGIGGILGSALQGWLGYSAEARRMLFEARVKAYSHLTGRVFNLFLEPDIVGLRDTALIFAKINALLSEAFLLASPVLVQLLGRYKVLVNEFHAALEAKDEKRSDTLHGELTALAGKIFDQMRYDLKVTDKSAWLAVAVSRSDQS